MKRAHLVCLLLAALLGQRGWAEDVKRVSQSASTAKDGRQAGNEPQHDAHGSAALAVNESLKRIATAQEAQATSGDSSEEKSDKKSDLKAQQDMAMWAENMFWVTLAGVVLTFAATLLLVATFRQTRRATFAALRSAAIGRQAVRVARQSSEQQFRAYVTGRVTGWNGIDGKAPLSVGFSIVAFGQTPAQSVKLFSIIEILPFPIPVDHVLKEPIENVKQSGTIFPGHATDGGTVILGRSLTKEEVSDVLNPNGVRRICFHGRITYKDIFDRDRETFFRLMMDPASITRDPSGQIVGTIWGPDERGNGFN